MVALLALARAAYHMAILLRLSRIDYDAYFMGVEDLVRKVRSQAAKDIATLRRECMRLDVELYRRSGRKSLLEGVRRVKREFPLPQSMR